jgi:hypothetical protein
MILTVETSSLFLITGPVQEENSSFWDDISMEMAVFWVVAGRSP